MSASTVSTPVSWNGRLANLALSGNLASSEFPGRLPPNLMPSGLAADDLPRGRVLVVADEAVVSLDLQRMLRDAGYRIVGPVSGLQEIERLIERGAIDCAVVDLEVDKRTPLPAADLLAYHDLPFVFVAGDGDIPPTPHRSRPVIRKPVDKESLLAALAKASPPRPQAGLAAGNGSSWPRIFPQL